jgi:hypothetical protein
MGWNAPKDPDASEFYFVVWCSEDGTNDGGSDDDGELQGATISSVVWTFPAGVTKGAQNQGAITIQGTAYAVDTVAAVQISGGTADLDYDILCEIVTSDNRTLHRTNTLRIREL